MKRRIIKINEDLCNGCELCVNACHESAIIMVDGKAKLVSDKYCDGLGDCLPECPTGAIKMIEREADEYDQEAVDERIENMKKETKVPDLACGCPGTHSKKIEKSAKVEPQKTNIVSTDDVPSELSQWPVQIKLINPNADYLKGANLLIAADCTAYAYGNFHKEFIKDHVTVIGCPKLDDNNYYIEKLTEILKTNDIKSITVVRMEVPCCGGIITAAKQAMLNSGMIVPYKEVTITVDGKRV